MVNKKASLFIATGINLGNQVEKGVGLIFSSIILRAFSHMAFISGTPCKGKNVNNLRINKKELLKTEKMFIMWITNSVNKWKTSKQRDEKSAE